MYNENEFKQLKGKKGKNGKHEILVEAYSNSNGAVLEKLKKKENHNEMLSKSCSSVNEIKFDQIEKKKYKLDLLAESCTNFDEDEHKQHKKKKNEQNKNPPFSVASTLFAESGSNSSHKQKHRKKHAETIKVENTFEPEINSPNKFEKQKNLIVAETCVVSDEPVTFPEKQKGRNNPLGNTKAYTPCIKEHDYTSSCSLNVETNIVFDKPETLKKYKKKHKACKDNLLTSTLNVKIDEFNKKSYSKRSKRFNKHLVVGDFDNSEVNYKRHKKDNISSDYVRLHYAEDGNLKLNSSPNNEEYPDCVADNSFNNCGLEKSGKTKKSKRKKKHKTDKESNLLNKNLDKRQSEHDAYSALNIKNEPNDDDADYSNQIIEKSESENIMNYSNGLITNLCDPDAQSPIKNESSLDERTEHLNFSSHLDCDEDPVDFEIPPLHKFETVYRLNEKQIMDLKALDVSIKTGKFTATEDEIIRNNFEDFKTKYGISDPFCCLLGIGKHKQDNEFLKFLKAKHFYVQLAKNLNDRSLHSVYKRARLILHPFRNAGKLTEKDISKLKQLHGSVNNAWQLIGDNLGNTAERCAETYRWHEKNVTKGEFSEEEEKQLIEALKKVSGSSDISCKNIKGISWETVAAYVPSRNGAQCRMYWANNLAWAPDSARKKWNKECYYALMCVLKDMNVGNSSMIDWFKVYDSFKDFAPSELYVRKRWLYLKSQVTDYKNKSDEEIMNILYDKYLL